MSFTYEAFVYLGKQTAYNFPLEWSYSQAGKRELRAIFKQVFKTFQENYSNPFPFHDELLQVFIPRMYYNYRIESRAYEEPAAILFTSATRKNGIRPPRSGCLGTPVTLPQSLYGRTDVRWRQNQNFSDQRVTKFSCLWCSASSAKPFHFLSGRRKNVFRTWSSVPRTFWCEMRRGCTSGTFFSAESLLLLLLLLFLFFGLFMVGLGSISRKSRRFYNLNKKTLKRSDGNAHAKKCIWNLKFRL